MTLNEQVHRVGEVGSVIRAGSGGSGRRGSPQCAGSPLPGALCMEAVRPHVLGPMGLQHRHFAVSCATMASCSPQTLGKPFSGLRLLPPERGCLLLFSQPDSSHLPSSCLLIKVRTALPSLPGGQAGWVHPPMATLVLWCFWLHGKCLSLQSSETPGGCPIAHLFRALSASAESWAPSMLPEGMGEPRETP